MQLWPFSGQASISSQSSQQLQLRIISFNIRYATSNPFTNEKPWPERFPLIMNQLHHETRFTNGAKSNPDAASIICLQEVLHSQLIDIMHSLNFTAAAHDPHDTPPKSPIWSYIGVGRDDGNTAGEYSPIIYPTAVFNLLHSEHIWLSPTPDKPSKGWDAGSIRILTIAVLEQKATGKSTLAACTHLDNAGSGSRRHSIGIILETLKRVEKNWALKGNLPAFLAGDFNSFPEREAYLLMKESGYMVDLREFVAKEKRYNDGVTFTGFEPEKDKDEQGRIDFIWLDTKSNVSGDAETPDGVKSAWRVDGYAVLPNVLDDGVYLSDHRCVVGDVRLLR